MTFSVSVRATNNFRPTYTALGLHRKCEKAETPLYCRISDNLLRYLHNYRHIIEKQRQLSN